MTHAQKAAQTKMPKSKKKQSKKQKNGAEKEIPSTPKESKSSFRNFSFRKKKSKVPEVTIEPDVKCDPAKGSDDSVESVIGLVVPEVVVDESSPRVSLTDSESVASGKITELDVKNALHVDVAGSPNLNKAPLKDSSNSSSNASLTVERDVATPLAKASAEPTLHRKPSFLRRKIAELVAGSETLRRSFSMNKDLNKPAKTVKPKRKSWYNSLTSLMEDADVGQSVATTSEQRDAETVGEERRVLRSQSMMVTNSEGACGSIEKLLKPAPSLRPRPVSCGNNLVLRGALFPDTSSSVLDLRIRDSSACSLPTHLDSVGGEHGGVDSRSGRLFTSAEDVKHKFGGSTSRIFRHKVFKNNSKTASGRSRSLTSIDALDPAMMVKGQPDVDSRSEPDTSDRLIVPPPGAQEVTSTHRRHKLARSQVSSSEYYSVSFELGDDPGPDEFVPASKGVVLAESINNVCLRKGIDINAVNIFLDVSKTPLPLWTTEASWLGGRHLRVRARDDKSPRGTGVKPGQVTLRKTNSGSYRGKSSRFFSSSTEDPSYVEAAMTSHEGSFKGSKASKQRWSGLFGNNKDTKMESLVEQLNGYSKLGIPQPQSQEDGDEDEDEEGLYNVEEDWREFVAGSEALSERHQQQQTAIWELLHTEVAYIRTLKVITDLFVSCLIALQSANILNEIDIDRLFSNVAEVHAANRRFWLHHLLPMLTTSRELRVPLDPRHMQGGFVKFEEIFEPYTKYCVEQSHCQQYCREKHQENELFTAYLAWCETQKDCNRLRLMDIVVKPMQRLTKYSLLLKAIHKNTESEEQRASLALMSRKVDEFVYGVNMTLRQRQDHERLRGIIARIETYDVVESKDDEVEKLVRLHSELDLNCAMPGCLTTQRRHLLLESDLKLKDNASSKMDVHCFLFTDLLLVCKCAGSKKGGEGRVKVVRQPYNVSRIVSQELARDPASLAVIYLNEYATVSAAFTLVSSEPKLIKTWLDGIRKAQELYAAARLASIPVPTLPVSRQPSSSSCFFGDDLEDGDDVDTHSCASLNMGPGLGLSRSPRGGSSRGSRVSSLAHSHSGSVEMEPSSMSSVSHSRGISVENEHRGSSLSSDEGTMPTLDPYPKPLPNPTSPIPPRRALLLKSPSPNTLSIQVPIFSGLGQSLPNLNLATTPHPPTPPTSLLLVPSSGKTSHHGLLSPGHRGVSYPPPSPPRGSLRRAFAIPQSRNPPLIKTRNVISTTTNLAVNPAGQKLHTTPVTSFDFDVPVIAGVSPPSEESITPEPIDGGAGRAPRHVLMKRLTRTSTDNRRYHTAGAIDDLKPTYIEDLKKQDARDSSIHKRLSWNCGQQNPNTPVQPCSASELARHRLAKRFVSTDSVQSSSGVSSTESGQFGSLTSGLEGLDLTLDEADDSGLPGYEDAQSCCYDLPHLPQMPPQPHPSPTLEAINLEVIKSCSNSSQFVPEKDNNPSPLAGVPATTPVPSTTPVLGAAPPLPTPPPITPRLNVSHPGFPSPHPGSSGNVSPHPGARSGNVSPLSTGRSGNVPRQVAWGPDTCAATHMAEGGKERAIAGGEETLLRLEDVILSDPSHETSNV